MALEMALEMARPIASTMLTKHRGASRGEEDQPPLS